MRSTHVFDEHVQRYSAVGLTRGTEPHHSNFWPRPIDGMTGYFSSIAGSQGCAAARTAQIACRVYSKPERSRARRGGPPPERGV